ncbi:MAG: cytochrome c oxidase assembly protein [Defluviimonas sp.]|nr:cytochrome c oxidase assembly protein [Defluviimonas sp.]
MHGQACYTRSARSWAVAGGTRGLWGLAAAIALRATPLRAHADGAPPAPHELWSMWSWQPGVVLPLVVFAGLYARGAGLAWAKAGMGRGVRAWQAASFAGGILALIAALIWPLDALGDSLFAAHMAQHIVLMGVAAPLLVLGLPIPTMMRAMPRGCQRGLAAFASSAAWRHGWGRMAAIGVAAPLQVLVFLFWHAPAAIAVSLQDDLVHSVMHGSIVGCALLFWTALVRRQGGDPGLGILSLLITFKVSLISGALLAFAPVAFYTSYGTRPATWGLSLIEDQQLAGLLMMTVGSMMYVVAAIVLLGVWMRPFDGAARPRRALRAPGHAGPGR